MKPPAIQIEPCKLCDPGLPYTWMVVLSGDKPRQAKFDTGIAMLRHIAQVHPEAVGLPTVAEQLSRARNSAYQRELEKELWMRRN